MQNFDRSGTLNYNEMTNGHRGIKLEKITAKFPGKLHRRSSLLIQIQERDRTKRYGVLLRVCDLVPRALWLFCQRVGVKRYWRIRKKLFFWIGCPLTACIVLLIKFQYPRVSPGTHPLTKSQRTLGMRLTR